jgi:hypothetical protein
MLNLDQVTLLCIENRSPDLAMFSINKCIKSLQFKKIVLVTNLQIPYEYPSNIELVQAPEIKTTEDYSNYLLSDLTSLIEGTHVLIIQWDSFIVNHKLWDANYLRYDYIGAPWPHHPQTPVGNGGFSLRSIKLIKALQNIKIPKKHPEDQCICIDNRQILESKYQIKFAPLEIAEKFGVERGCWRETFGFHGFFNFHKVLSDRDLRHVAYKIPSQFLNGIDTYELIKQLVQNNKIKLAYFLLKKSFTNKTISWRKTKIWLQIITLLYSKKIRP